MYKIGESFYSKVFKEIVEVESVKVAELSKLLENIHRAVNLGMINEFKMTSEVLDVDPFDVILRQLQSLWFRSLLSGPRLGRALHSC